MKIYCAGSIRGDISFQKFYKEIISYISSIGHEPLSEFNSDYKKMFAHTDNEIFTRDIKWLEQSDFLVAEVSGASLGVGFEIGYALYKLKIPVLAVFNHEVGAISAMISGCTSELLTVHSYNSVEHLHEIIYNFINLSK